MIWPLIDAIIDKAPAPLLARILSITPRSVFVWKRDAAFRRMVKYAYKNSPFYRRKFAESGIDPRKVRSPRDLGEFYTTPIDIIEHAEEFLCTKPHLVFESSGTTGRNKRIYLTQKELDHIGKCNAIGLALGGIKADDRMVNAFDFCIWIPGMITQRSIDASRILGMAAGKVDPAEVYRRIPIYKFNIVLGEPTWLIKLTELAEQGGAWPLKFIIGSAEEMPDKARPWMEKVWQGAKVRMLYASVESAGILAFEVFDECGTYHIDENNFLVEIADPGADGYGEVVFTTLSRTAMPLIRYKNRDVSKIIEEKCPCGLSFRRLARIRGRTDEMIIASGGNLYPLMFDSILKDVAGITNDWQIVFRLKDIKEVMEFNLELKDGVSKETVREKIFENIKGQYPDLWKNYTIAIFEMGFVYHKPGDIRAGKHKLIRLVDKRYAR